MRVRKYWSGLLGAAAVLMAGTAQAQEGPTSLEFKRDFNTVGDYVALPNTTCPAYVGARQMTISAWIKPSEQISPCCNDTPTGTIVAWSQPHNPFLEMRVQGGKLFIVERTPFGANFPAAQIAATIDPCVWTHVALTYNNGSLSYYIDGVLDTTTTINLTNGANFYNRFSIAANVRFGGPQILYDGLQQEVSLWNKALDATAIAGLLDGIEATDPDYANLVGYWKMDDGIGQQVTDASGNGRHGTLGVSASVGSDDPAWAATTQSVCVVPNSAPTANAGPDISVTTLELATTTVSGTGSDADAGDTLTCIWLDGATVLLGPVTLTGTTCDLDLSTVVPPLAPGVHTLTIEISDGIEFATDTMQLTVENPPVANAGMDASTHPGDTVNLNGGGSMDDQTASVDLLYAWSFVAVPPTSAAVLSGATTATPSFVSDLLGTYRVQLVVTDEDGHVSLADEVIISSENIAPTADAGTDRVVQIGNLAVLDGSLSSDPDTDGLTYSWTIDSAPVGSVAALVDATTVTPTITPDLEGSYVIRLVVNDGFVDSVADTVDVTAIGPAYAQAQLAAACAAVSALPDASFDAKGHRKSMCNGYAKIIKFLQQGKTALAIQHLTADIERVDGCTLRMGVPDPKGKGQPHAADYLVICAEQVQVYDLLTAALSAIE